jgi:osmotically-inducible protein OsmY
MKTDEILQKDVQESLKWEPQLQAAEIGVIAKEGVVTLTGTVDSYYKKSEAEKAVKKVHGVKAIVEEIAVRPSTSKSISDSYLAAKILELFKSNFSIPDKKIFVFVEKGWVTLEGSVNWNYQKEAAKNAVTGLDGVRGISNHITTKSERKDAVKKSAIEKALSSNAALEDDDIHVLVKDSDVILSGLVKSLWDKEEAERIAWKAPGIWSVSNEIIVD